MARETVDYHDRIVRSPEILVGRPIVKGTQIPVELVLEKLAANPSIDELFLEYPRLTVDDVRAVFAYAREKIAETPDFVSPRSFIGKRPSARTPGGFWTRWRNHAHHRDDLHKFVPFSSNHAMNGG